MSYCYPRSRVADSGSCRSSGEYARLVRCLLIPSLLWAVSVGAATLLSPTEFARLYIERVEQIYPETQGKLVDYLEVSITMEDDREFTSFLDNAYREYRTFPDSLPEILAKYVESIETSLSSQDPDKRPRLLVPIIKHRDYVVAANDLVRKKNPELEPEDNLYYEPLNSELVVLYAFDSEKSLRYASRRDIAELAKPNVSLREFAIGNLAALLPQISRDGDDSLSMIIADGTFEASLLLFDDIWTKQNFAVSGDIVVFVPTRDLVFVTGSRDEAGLARAREIVNGNNWPYLISLQGFVRKNGTWKVFNH